jgi:hypothetical protein
MPKPSEEDKERFRSLVPELGRVAGSAPFGPSERPMGGYLALPESYVDQPDLARPWVERALTYVATLPPKVKKPRKPTSR